MLFLVIVAFIATVSFFRRAREIGIHPGKAASIPFFAAGMMLALAYLMALAIRRVLDAMNVPAQHAEWAVVGLNWALVLAYLVFITRNWGTISADSQDKRCTDSTDYSPNNLR